MFDDLKKELLQAQKMRGDLMKWKLVVIAGVGATALGFTKEASKDNASLALCVIPFACCYVDLLCRNLSIRTKLISAFIAQERDQSEVDAKFELFYKDFDGRRWWDALEGIALIVSTMLVSVVVMLVGPAVRSSAPDTTRQLIASPNVLFIGAGAVGLVGALTVSLLYWMPLATLMDPPNASIMVPGG